MVDLVWFRSTIAAPTAENYRVSHQPGGSDRFHRPADLGFPVARYVRSASSITPASRAQCAQQ